MITNTFVVRSGECHERPQVLVPGTRSFKKVQRLKFVPNVLGIGDIHDEIYVILMDILEYD